MDKEMSQYSGGSMKKFAVALLTSAFALAITPVASADSFNFSGPVNTSFGTAAPGTISFNITFTTGTAVGDGTSGVAITGVTGTYNNTGDGLTGALTLYDGSGSNGSPILNNPSPNQTATYDNVFYPSNDAPEDTSAVFPYISPFPKNYTGGYFDNYGLLMTFTDGTQTIDVNFWANQDDPGNTPNYNVIEIIQGCMPSDYPNSPDACYIDESNGMSALYQTSPGNIASTPEPSSLLLLGTGLLGLAFIAYRKQLKSEQ
jgi:hypothetical protein